MIISEKRKYASLKPSENIINLIHNKRATNTTILRYQLPKCMYIYSKLLCVEGKHSNCWYMHKIHLQVWQEKSNTVVCGETGWLRVKKEGGLHCLFFRIFRILNHVKKIRKENRTFILQFYLLLPNVLLKSTFLFSFHRSTRLWDGWSLPLPSFRLPWLLQELQGLL